ncbi:putative oxalate decarboxylase/oxidase [Hygrophoropsis aurantiaca]|uniref:Oxalate decarboxylase/oxidase n=1 Tax=Hygrophoropsis aurantiaca TaxID=72124 RepID=A0ACB8AEU1_9AGAM|nr:putative oxalate decarboxylase/oxidase [Hygrophoropsis aurantiaca]
MAKLAVCCLAIQIFAAIVAAAPASSSTSSAPSSSPTVPYASDDPNAVLYVPNSDIVPVPERGGLGASILGPQNIPIDLENPDLLAPPTTDNGDVPNAKWPMGLSHNRLQTGGWARQQNIEVMSIATEMAGVNMRLEAGAIRELHWHKTAEWAYIFKGGVQVTSVNSDGQNFIDTVGPGDLWYFPAGIPHSLQATNDSAEGAEFLLVFDDGTFSEDATFLLTDWLAHVPKEVIAKNFQTSLSAFDEIPSRELYIFPAAAPPDNQQAPSDPQGTAPSSFTYALSNVSATPLSGGSVKVVDSTVFPISQTIAAAVVTIDPGAMREMHWHPTQDEWSFFLEGNARMTIFASSSNARTFDYQAGDVGYVPASYGHYVENIGNTTVTFLEIFKTDKYQDVSLQQWLALTPPALVKAHLQLSDETIAGLNKTKHTVVGPA